MFRLAAFLVLSVGVATRAEDVRIFYDFLENGRLSGGRLNVDLSEAAERSRFGADLPAAFQIGGWAVTTVRDNGPSDNRIDIVILGDGYTASQMTTYANHVNNVVTPFFSQEPLAAYAKYFNVHRVDVVSIDSGVDEIDLGIFKNTALDMQYGCFNIERLLCIHVGKAYAAAGSAPAWDQILALANSTRYGGAGYPDNDLGTLAGNNISAVEIALHEFGHAFADLHDEYDYADGATYSGGEPIEPNVSIFQAADLQSMQAKWFRWLDVAAVDAFEGAAYCQFGIYRPTFNSKMRSLNRPFEQVNVEQLVMSIYRSVSIVDDATPTSANPLPACHALFVTPLQPVGHSLAVQWSVNGNPAPGATGPTFIPADGPLTEGVNTVSVTVVDPTTRVRDEDFRAAFMTFSRSWPVQGLAAGCFCSATAQVEPTAVSKGRYLSFAPAGISAGSAIRVRLESLMHPSPANHPGSALPDYSALEGQVRWVGPPQLVAEDGGSGGPFLAASLQCEPHYQDWSDIPLLHVTGSEVVPSSTYAIQAVGGGCDPEDEFNLGGALHVATGRWADVVEPFQDPGAAFASQPDVLDISSVVDKLKIVPAALPRVRVQLQPAQIELEAGISVLDVSATVDSVKGGAFPFDAPLACSP